MFVNYHDRITMHPEQRTFEWFIQIVSYHLLGWKIHYAHYILVINFAYDLKVLDITVPYFLGT